MTLIVYCLGAEALDYIDYAYRYGSGWVSADSMSAADLFVTCTIVGGMSLAAGLHASIYNLGVQNIFVDGRTTNTAIGEYYHITPKLLTADAGVEMLPASTEE